MIERIPYNIKFGSGAGMRIWARIWKGMSCNDREVFMKYYKEVLEELRIDYYIDGDIQV